MYIVQTDPFGKFFLSPVDPVALGIPTYFDIIKDPMDLGTINSKLERGRYASPEEFEADVRLVLHNCFLFNHPGKVFYDMIWFFFFKTFL